MFFAQMPHSGRPLPTVDGPEDPAVLRGTRGTIVSVDSTGPTQLEVVSLPELRRRTLRLASGVLCVSGPDQEGRVVYLDREAWGDHGHRPTPLIRVVSLVDGTESVLIERAGALNVSSRIALAPVGGRIALVSSIDRGGYDFTPWVLEVIDLATGRTTAIPGEIAQHRPRWFPDGRRLAFVEWRSTTRTLVTSIIDLETSERRVVGDGMIRCVSSDGSSLLFGKANELRRIDVATGSELQTGLRLKGSLFHDADGEDWGLVADFGDGKVLYEGLPTTGTKQELVSGPCARAGAKWTVKLCDLSTGSFVTVVPRLFVGDVSYGSFAFPDGVAAR
jgi:hypothetical protein